MAMFLVKPHKELFFFCCHWQENTVRYVFEVKYKIELQTTYVVYKLAFSLTITEKSNS